MDRPSARTSLDRDGVDRLHSISRELGVDAFGAGVMVLEPGQRMRIHRHREQDEVYVVLAGRLEVTVEAPSGDDGREVHELAADDVLAVAAPARRRLANPFRERVVLLALGGAGTHQFRDAEAFTEWDETTGAQPRDVPLPDDLSSSELRD